ncbi:MAG: ParB/RepB/Spo0J family partition protein [Candidatus Spechtbacteria bacterium]|nr:ParB/RepB/Spo0J family partition protein [Candidatus Spechtbacteria bacterium]
MRGLESLIPKKKDVDDKVSSKESVFMIEVEKIHPNPFQPRREFQEEELQELASSIRQFGILQPLIVTKVEKDTPTGRDVEYELIAGERRLRAAKLANLPRVPVVVRRSATPEKLSISMMENLQREDLSPMEEARAYERLHKEFKMTHEEIGEQIGKSSSVVSNAVRMLRLPEDMMRAVDEKKIPVHLSRFLLMFTDAPEKQRKLFQEMLVRNLDADAAQKRVWEMQKDMEINRHDRRRTHGGATQSDPELTMLAEQMKDTVGIYNVKVNRIGRKARILMEFPTKGQLLAWMRKIIEA